MIDGREGKLPMIYVTQPLLEATARLLASFAPGVLPNREDEARKDEDDDGDRGDGGDCEGVVYWLGLELGRRAVVTTLVVPDADAGAGRVATSAAVNAEALSVVIGTPLVLLGQAHSHPSRYVDHSWVDDRDTFAQFPGALSVVVPFYGWHGMNLSECGVHRHMDGRYRRVKGVKVGEHLRVLPGMADFRKRHEVVESLDGRGRGGLVEGEPHV
jgi:hypothetical protein